MSDDPTRLTLPELLAICEESDADAETGRIVPASVVHAKIEAALAEFEQTVTPRRPKASRAR